MVINKSMSRQIRPLSWILTPFKKLNKLAKIDQSCPCDKHGSWFLKFSREEKESWTSTNPGKIWTGSLSAEMEISYMTGHGGKPDAGGDNAMDGPISKKIIVL